MTLYGRDVLLVGQNLHRALVLTDRLHRWRFRCHFVGNIRAASELLSAQPVNLVLSNTRLPDGNAFGLLVALSGLPITAVLCLPLEKGCFWLPAIDDGKACLGLPALRPSEFARTLEEMTRSLGAPPRVSKSILKSGVA